MKRLLSLLVLCFIMSGATSFAQVMKPVKFEEYDLPNGLHVILYQERSAPVVAVRVYYHVGSKDERPDRTGFAHFFEHLMFEGTNQIARGEYGKLIESVGGELNAHTASDRTFYNDDVPSNQMRLALWMESDRMNWLKVDSVGVETQRQVVKEERRNRYDNQPYGTFFLKMMESVFKKSQYHWTPIGEAQYIDQSAISEFVDFYRTYYIPNNATLVVAGDFETAEAKKAVEEYFGDIPKGKPITRDYISEPLQTEERYMEVAEKHTPLPAVAYSWKTVPDGDKDMYPLDLLVNVFARGSSSRLVKRLQDKDQLTVNLQPLALNMEKDGVFGFLAVAKAGIEVDKVRAAMDDEINKLIKDGVSDEEYQKVKNQTLKDLVVQASSIQNVAFGLSHMYTIFKDTKRYNSEIDRYNAVTKQDLQRVAKKYLTKEGKNVIVYTVPKAN